MKKNTSIVAHSSAAILGGLALDLTSSFENPMLRENAIYMVPAFTIFLSYLFNILANLGAMSFTDLIATWSSRGYFRELQKQIEDPLISESRREEKRQEYEEALDAKLAMKKGWFTIFKSANERARDNTNTAIQHKTMEEESNNIKKLVNQHSQTKLPE